MLKDYHGDVAAGSDPVVPTPHAHVVRVLAPPHEVLHAHVVGLVVHHPAATVHPKRVTAAEVGGEIATVSHAIPGAALEVPVLVEGNLRKRKFCNGQEQSSWH